ARFVFIDEFLPVDVGFRAGLGDHGPVAGPDIEEPTRRPLRQPQAVRYEWIRSGECGDLPRLRSRLKLVQAAVRVVRGLFDGVEEVASVVAEAVQWYGMLARVSGTCPIVAGHGAVHVPRLGAGD